MRKSANIICHAMLCHVMLSIPHLRSHWKVRVTGSTTQCNQQRLHVAAEWGECSGGTESLTRILARVRRTVMTEDYLSCLVFRTYCFPRNHYLHRIPREGGRLVVLSFVKCSFMELSLGVLFRQNQNINCNIRVLFTIFMSMEGDHSWIFSPIERKGLRTTYSCWNLGLCVVTTYFSVISRRRFLLIIDYYLYRITFRL
jgi:hypothetical protein